MGQSQSAPEQHEVPIEQVSHELALRFADRCYSHLEITHFKDNFKTLADHQDGLEYWKEETLCRFLSLPDTLNAGAVIYQMATYLGSFPFPSLAPCILTREAMLKVVTIMTGRYKRVLKRGDQDRHKLLFRSMAVFDRRSSALSPVSEKPSSVGSLHDKRADRAAASPVTDSHPVGFTVDQPLNDDDEEEDDDDLALAALEALDAIEVFKQDEKKERKISQAHIPVENLHKLLMMILLMAPLTPQDNIATYCQSLDQSSNLKSLKESATAMITAFHPDTSGGGIRYTNFVKAIATTMPYLFRPLNPLFEHFLFSRNIDLSKHSSHVVQQDVPSQPRNLPSIQMSTGGAQAGILNEIVLAQLSTSIEIVPAPTSSTAGLFHPGMRFNELYSTTAHGTSMSSFSRQVLSWRSATLFLISGTLDNDETIVLGAYLPEAWKEASDSQTTSEVLKSSAMFQLKPRHAVFRANTYNRSTPLSHFSAKTGIALGCVIPSQSKIQALHQTPVLGPVSLLVDEDISTATFQHDPDAGIGAFLTDPMLEELQSAGSNNHLPKKVQFDIDTLEVWGVSFADTGEDEIANQKKRLAWEEAEAARRRGVNFGGDKDGARALLEMAGIVGDKSGNRSGGSI